MKYKFCLFSLIMLFVINVNGEVLQSYPKKQQTAREWNIQGNNFFENKNYKKALECFMESAKMKDSTGEFNVGIMYANGYGVTKNYKTAAEYYQRAANKGHVSAMNNLGSLYYNGQGVNKDIKKAYQLYCQAAEKGYEVAKGNMELLEKKDSTLKDFREVQYNMPNTLYYRGLNAFYAKDYTKAEHLLRQSAEKDNDESAMYLLGQLFSIIKQDYPQALSWYKKAAEKGHGGAENRIGVLFFDGTGVKQDYKQALEWFLKAAKHENVASGYNLGYMYENGLGVEKDNKQAFDYYHKAALQEYPEAILSVGWMYENGLGVEKNLKQAAYWYQKGAELGDAEAQYSLGMAYEKGEGLDQNYEQALKWFLESAKQGNTDAEINIGAMYESGLGVEKDYKKSFEWYKKAADSGSEMGKGFLGYLYMYGNGIEKDENKAFNLLKQAAEGGFDWAQCETAYMLTEGIGTKQDDKQAIEWYTKAASQEYSRAENDLGWMYEHGRGVDKDYKKAYEWYLKAANHGNEVAMNHLAQFYENGYYVPKDVTEAMYWYKKAEKAGSDKAKERISQLSGMLAGSNTTKGVSGTAAIIEALPPKGKRIALIIGNSDYQVKEMSLLNATNDAHSMTRKLKELDFDIFTLPNMPSTNLKLQEMDELLTSFCEKAEQYDVALFFYAGHAVQHNGVNYLLPVDVPDIKKEIDLKYKCMSMTYIMEHIDESNVPTKIFILDACRNNPFKFTRGVLTQGLAAMSGSEGSYLAYAAQPDKSAQDGKGLDHSPYTQALLEVLDIPRLNIRDVFQRVRNIVLKKTNREQWPSEINNLSGEFFFNYK